MLVLVLYDGARSVAFSIARGLFGGSCMRFAEWKRAGAGKVKNPRKSMMNW